MPDAPPPPPPVPGLPTPALADGHAVAKAWIERLVVAAPLSGVADVPVATLAQEAPALCATLVRALAGDDELGLLPVLAANAPAMAGARDVAAAAAAVAALRDAAFTTILASVEGADGAWTAALARRTAYACDRLLGVAFEAPGPGPAPRSVALDPLPDPLAALDPDLVLGRDGAPAWERMVARAVGRHLEDGQTFAVLAVEAEGADRLLAADGGPQALERADRALGDTVRARDRVVCDPPSRWWVLVPEAGADAARALARRIADAVGEVEHAGVGLRVSAGLVVCPRDGADAATLVLAAEERLLDARASGVLLADDG